MNFFQKLKVIILVPYLWIALLRYKHKSESEVYYFLQKKSKFLLSYLGYHLSVEGVENIPLNEAVLFVSNHQGTLDPALIVASSPLSTAFVSKKENEKMPIFGRASVMLGSIHFDRESREGNIFMLRSAARRLKDHKSLLIFPEGTRSKGDEMNEFKAGSLQPAYLSKVSIVPITLNHSYCLDDKHDKNRELKITYGKKIAYEDYKNMKHEELTHQIQKIIKKSIEY